MKENIKNMLLKSKFDSKTQNQLFAALENIYNIQEAKKCLKIKLFEKEVEHHLNIIIQYLIELQLKLKNNSGLLSFIKLDQTTSNLQAQIKQKILDLESSLNYSSNSLNCDAEYIRNFQILDLNHIRTQMKFTLQYQKIQAISLIIDFIIFQSDQQHLYQMIISRKYLIQKFQQYFKEQKDIIQKLKNERETALFTLKYCRTNQQFQITVENDPYIISSELNQSKIYLQEEMVIVFDNFYKLKVLETNTINLDRQQLSSYNQTKYNQNQNTIQIKGFGYIKFESASLNNKTYEFYLKDSNLDLSSHIQGTQAILYHDCNGFYMIPQKQSKTCQLYYNEELISQDKQINFGIQLQNKFYLDVEVDKQKSDILFLD